MQQVHRQLDPNELGRQYDLGGFRATYQISKVLNRLRNALFLIGPIVFTLLCVTLLFTYVPYPASVIVALVSLVGLCLLAIILFRKGRKRGWSCTLVYDDGFICSTSKGEVLRVIRWIDIESFVRSTEGRYSSGYYAEDNVSSLILKHGTKTFELDETFGKKFIQAVESAITLHLYPSAQAAYLSGNVVHFGRLDVSQEGLYDTKKKATLPWREVESIRISARVPIYGSYANTLIRMRGKKLCWTSIDVGEIKNAEVLRRLVAECVVPVHGVKLIP